MRGEFKPRRTREKQFHLQATFVPGAVRVELLEKSCVPSSLCGATGQQHAEGLNFTFTNQCCDTHLCNEAAPGSRRRTLTLLPLLLYAVW